TQPSAGGPSFLHFPSFDEVFTPSSEQQTNPGPLKLSLTPRNLQEPNEPTPKVEELLFKNQAGIGGAQGGILIDQHGRFIYYAIHVNPAFLSYLRAHNLTTLDGLGKIDPTLTLPTGIMELKSAWMIVKNKKSAPTYFVVPAKVQHYVVIGGALVPQIDKKTNK